MLPWRLLLSDVGFTNSEVLEVVSKPPVNKADVVCDVKIDPTDTTAPLTRPATSGLGKPCATLPTVEVDTGFVLDAEFELERKIELMLFEAVL